MVRLLHPIFALLASVSRQELARQVAYLREENRILRARLPERLIVTDKEKRRLLRYPRHQIRSTNGKLSRNGLPAHGRGESRLIRGCF